MTSPTARVTYVPGIKNKTAAGSKIKASREIVMPLQSSSQQTTNFVHVYID
jgi:hypothetical protein